MPNNIINASSAGSGGLITTAADSGSLDLQSDGTTVLALTSSGATVTGTGSVSGNLSFNSGYGSAAVAYGCRAWVNFNGTGTVAIRASGNVTSITDNNVGSYTINFTTALVDANYSVSGIPRNTQTYGAIQVLAIDIAQATAPTTSALAITVTGQNDGAVRAAVDSDYVCISVFR
jgi:hypothetical protein